MRRFARTGRGREPISLRLRRAALAPLKRARARCPLSLFPPGREHPTKKHPEGEPSGCLVAAPRKPGSVARRRCLRRASGHSSGTLVTERLVRPTQGLGRATLERPSTWPCSGWGLPCHNRYRLRGGLLPHLFTLTRCAEAIRAVSFSVALSSRFPSPGVTRHPALRSPDFPREVGLKDLARSPEMLRRAELTCPKSAKQAEQPEASNASFSRRVPSRYASRSVVNVQPAVAAGQLGDARPQLLLGARF